ncbi:MAG: 4Fe-4S dicluster domain-containing protein [bacterium]
MNYGFIIDNRKCIGCHACTVACKSEHDVPIGVNRTWVKYMEKGEFPNTRRVFSVMRCNHCADAPCVDICPTAALFNRVDGIVDFDNRRCIGCRACMQACPYDALYLDPETSTAAKCNYCAHRIEIGLEPSCVNVCPEHAIISGDLDNPASEIAQLMAREQVTARKVDKGTQPKLFYIDGDEISLNPILAEQSEEYMWSSQSSGVGHFAKYAEERLARNAQNVAEESTWVGDEADKVLVPSQDMQGKAEDVVQERARRVYDAPDKGVIWGRDVSAYIWTKAVSTGVFLVLFLAMSLGSVQVDASLQWFGISTGLFFLAITTWLLVKDLDQAKRFVYVLLRPQWKSWLVRGGYALTLYGTFLALWGVAVVFKWRPLLVNPILWGCGMSAIIAAVYTAFLFAQAKGRDFWQSPMLSLHMLIHSLLAGTSALVLFFAFAPTNPAWMSFLRTLLLSAIAFNLLILTIELLTTHPTEDSRRVVQMITTGQFSRLFWFGSLFGGTLVPLVLATMGETMMLALSGGLVLIGIYITEHIWVRAPQLIPLS